MHVFFEKGSIVRFNEVQLDLYLILNFSTFFLHSLSYDKKKAQKLLE
jgi:hypothetical protein